MKRLLFPDIYVESILDIPLDKLFKHHIRAFILDLDNTVTEWNSNEVTNEIRAWIKSVKDKGFKACIVSNNGQKRVLTVADNLGIPFVFKAGKPRRRAFKKALEVMGCHSQQTAVVGDQLFTDVLGGNRMNMFTILVVPINRREFIGTRIMRHFERLVLRRVTRTVTVGDIDSAFKNGSCIKDGHLS